jgi:hypothetical protein
MSNKGAPPNKKRKIEVIEVDDSDDGGNGAGEGSITPAMGFRSSAGENTAKFVKTEYPRPTSNKEPQFRGLEDVVYSTYLSYMKPSKQVPSKNKDQE